MAVRAAVTETLLRAGGRPRRPEDRPEDPCADGGDEEQDMILYRCLQRLERNLRLPAIDPEQCRIWDIGAIVLDDSPTPPTDEIPRCRTCGGQHVIRDM